MNNYNTKSHKTYNDKKSSGFRGERRPNSNNNSYKRTGANGNRKPGGYKPNNNNFKKKPPMTPPVDINDLKNAITKKIDESVDKEKFYYRYNLNEKKKETGIIGLSLKTYLKEDQKKERYVHIYIIRDRSKKVSVTITDGTLSSATVLFYTISNDPTEKVLRFLPQIIESLQKLTLEIK